MHGEQGRKHPYLELAVEKPPETETRELPEEFFSEEQEKVMVYLLEHLPIQLSGSSAKIAHGIQRLRDTMGDFDGYTTREALTTFVATKFMEEGGTNPLDMLSLDGSDDHKKRTMTGSIEGIDVDMSIEYMAKYGGSYRLGLKNEALGIDIEIFDSTKTSGTLRLDLEGVDTTPVIFTTARGNEIPMANRETLDWHYLYITLQGVLDSIYKPNGDEKLGSRFVSALQLFHTHEQLGRAFDVIEEHLIKGNEYSMAHFQKAKDYIAGWIPESTDEMMHVAESDIPDVVAQGRAQYKEWYQGTQQAMRDEDEGNVGAIDREVDTLQALEEESSYPFKSYIRTLIRLLQSHRDLRQELALAA